MTFGAGPPNLPFINYSSRTGPVARAQGLRTTVLGTIYKRWHEIKGRRGNRRATVRGHDLTERDPSLFVTPPEQPRPTFQDRTSGQPSRANFGNYSALAVGI
jgi:hypothetical protein